MHIKTRFGEILKEFPKGKFEQIVQMNNANKYKKSFSAYDHLIALIYAQLSGSTSLRQVETGFNVHSQHHYHLGTGQIKRSTLSDANNHRNPDIFKQLVSYLIQFINRKQRKELNTLLYLLDSTPIQLRDSWHDWAKATATTHHRGLKAHIMLEGNVGNPSYFSLSNANINDITAVQDMEFQSGATYVFDKGYTDYNWWLRITKSSAYFVTRFKKNAAIQVAFSKPVSGDILSDEIVHFKNKSNRAKHKNHHYGIPLRKICIYREGSNPLLLATNDFSRPAEEIAELYKNRWGIELFFKWLKQNLRIKKFLGQSKTAVEFQLYAAMITYLLLWLYRQNNIQTTVSMYLMLVELRSTLFERLDINKHNEYRRNRCESERYINKIQYRMEL